MLHIEAINGDALDLGSGSEIPALFAARQKAQERFIAVVREDLNNHVTLAHKDVPIQHIKDLKGKRGLRARHYLNDARAQSAKTCVPVGDLIER